MYILKFLENSDVECNSEISLFETLQNAQMALADQFEKMCRLLGGNFAPEEDEEADADCQRRAQCQENNAHIQVCTDVYSWEVISDDRFVPAQSIERLKDEKNHLRDELEKYEELYGDIIFPQKPEGLQSYGRAEVYANPAGWMYSYDGIHWERAPMDIGKIAYNKAFFRRIPKGVTVGVSTDVQKHPELYQYSSDNGYSWHNLRVDDNPSGHTWIYHGNHANIWFAKRR